MSENSQQVWLISGATRGIGLAIAQTALASGHKVAAGGRNPEDLKAILADFEGQAIAVKLDVDIESDIKNAVAQTLKVFGRIDVLVNNAGYGLQGTIEEVTMEQVRQQMETNFFGLIGLTREVVPTMRKQGSGYIFNISSVAGLRGAAGVGIYNASKFAVEGFSEALTQEMAPFGVKVSVVEPGPYRTDWSGSSLVRSNAMKNAEAESPYREFNASAKEFFDSRSGKQPGDPFQIAKVLVDATRDSSQQIPVHMIFGDVALKMWEQRLQQYPDPAWFKQYPHEKITV